MKKNMKDRFQGSPRAAKRVHTISGIVLNYEGSSDLTFVRSPDVSTRGMFISTARTFPEGAVLNVRFRLALTGASVRARGEVRYSLPGVGIGLEFVDLDPAMFKLLEGEVDRGMRTRKTHSRSGRSNPKNKRTNEALTISKRRRRAQS